MKIMMLIFFFSSHCRHSARIIGNQLIIFGGWDAPVCYNDVYTLDLGERINTKEVIVIFNCHLVMNYASSSLALSL